MVVGGVNGGTAVPDVVAEGSFRRRPSSRRRGARHDLRHLRARHRVGNTATFEGLGSAPGDTPLREAWRRWLTTRGVSWHLDEDLIDAGEDVIATYRGRRRERESGALVGHRITLVWSVRGGKVVRLRAYGERAHALESLGLLE